VGELSAEINARMRRLEPVLFPPVLQLETSVASEEQEEPFDFGLLFLPGILVMSLIFIAQGTSEDLWKEQELGTLRRAVSLPRPLAAFLAGKLLAGSVLLAAVSLAGLLIAVLGYGRSPASVLPGLAWCTFTGTALLVLFTLLQLCATSRRAGSVLTSLVLFPLMMIGGSFFPFETMPGWMQSVGRWTPNGLAVVHLKDILRGSVDPGALALAALGIALPAALAFLACNALLRGRFLAR
jgi:ABC-type multidrug transport system permease subunit